MRYSNNTFKQDNEFGKIGEALFEQYAKSLGWEIVNTSQDKRFQDISVDYVVRNRKGKVSKIEVKYDRQISKYGNLCCEHMTNVEKNIKGWLTKSDNDNVIWYIDSESGMAHIVSAGGLKRYIDKYDKRLTRIDDYKNNKTVMAWLVNLEDYKAKGYQVISVMLG